MTHLAKTKASDDFFLIRPSHLKFANCKFKMCPEGRAFFSSHKRLKAGTFSFPPNVNTLFINDHYLEYTNSALSVNHPSPLKKMKSSLVQRPSERQAIFRIVLPLTGKGNEGIKYILSIDCALASIVS